VGKNLVGNLRAPASSTADSASEADREGAAHMDDIAHTITDLESFISHLSFWISTRRSIQLITLLLRGMPLRRQFLVMICFTTIQ